MDDSGRAFVKARRTHGEDGDRWEERDEALTLNGMDLRYPSNPSMLVGEDAEREPLTEADPLAFNWQEDDQAANWEGRDYTPPLSVKSASVGNVAVKEGVRHSDMDVPVDPKPDGPRYAAMGDAVTTNVAEWIGLRVVAALERESAEAPASLSE